MTPNISDDQATVVLMHEPEHLEVDLFQMVLFDITHVACILIRTASYWCF